MSLITLRGRDATDVVKFKIKQMHTLTNVAAFF